MKIVDANTVSLDATFTEAAVPAGSNPLAYYYIQYQSGSNPPTLGPHIPASVSGGETVHYTLLVPAPDNAVTTYTFEVFAVDSLGKPSPPSNSVTDTINRTGPSAPTSFTIG